MTNKTNYPKLMEAGRIGSVRIKNRLIRAGSNQGFPPEYDDGYLQSYYTDFYEGMAKGGVGMVTIGASPLGVPPGRGYRLDDDKYIQGLKTFTDRMHSHECAVFLQTFHLGPWLPGELSGAASTIPEAEMPTTMQTLPNAHSLTVEEIKGIVRETGNRIERAYKAGFDGVEINAGCTHLYTHFLSRLWNRREDEYGYATMENRSRIVVEIIQEIRKRTSKDFAIVVLFNAIEPGLKDGITPEEGIGFAKIFEAAGADALIPRVEFYNHHDYDNKNEPTHFPDVVLYPETSDAAKESGIDTSRYGACGWVPLQKAVRKAVNIPVIAVGRMDADCAEELLENGEIDFISMTRNLIADHGYPKKVFEGRLDDIAPCTGCMTCFDLGEQGLPVTCRINPAAFKEAAYEIKATKHPKRVVVVGGGAAGMEAARVAALRGHHVTLMEKEKILGGAMNPYSVIMGECKEDIQSMVSYFRTQITKLGVDIRLGTEATRGNVAARTPDVVITAVGGRQSIPDIPGVRNGNVLTGSKFYGRLKDYLVDNGGRLMADLDPAYVPVGKSVAVIGGDFQGTQTAEFLVKRGVKVTIVEPGPDIAANVPKNLVRPQVLDWLYRHNVAQFTDATIEEITDSGVVITGRDGKRQAIAADTVIITLPFEPDETLFNTLKDVAPEVYNIGDSAAPGKVENAVADGARIGREI